VFVIGCNSKRGLELRTCLGQAAYRREGRAEIGQVCGIVRHNLEGKLELCDGVGKTALLAVNCAEIAQQRSAKIISVGMDGECPREIS
jgi:hypothetical protein